MSTTDPLRLRFPSWQLKMGERLVIGGARLQCAPYRYAVAELVAREILEASSTVELLYGEGAAVLTHLGV